MKAWEGHFQELGGVDCPPPRRSFIHWGVQQILHRERISEVLRGCIIIVSHPSGKAPSLMCEKEEGNQNPQGATMHFRGGKEAESFEYKKA